MLGCEVGRGELDYEVYLRTESLLSLQTDRDELAHRDEMMFQIVHQAQELWLKLLGHEAVDVVRLLDEDELGAARSILDRMTRIIRVMASELDVIATLTPESFLTIRRFLGNGSGQQSPGFNRLKIAAEYMASALDRLLGRRELTMYEVYTGADPGLERLAEQLTDLDASYQGWLHAHYLLVRRTIGVSRRVRALDGQPTQALRGRMNRPLFPSLWEARVEITRAWSRDGGEEPAVRMRAEASSRKRR